MDNITNEVVVAIVPFQTQTHLDPFLQFACLISSYNLPVYYLSLPTFNHNAKARASALNPSDLAKIHFHDVQMSTTSTTPLLPSEVPKHFHPHWNVTTLLRESIASFLTDVSSKSRRVVVIHDCIMCYNVQDVSSFNNVESYIFNPSVSGFGMYCDHIAPQAGLAIPLEEELLQKLPSSEGLYCNEIMRLSAFQFAYIGKNYRGEIYNTSKVMEGDNTFIDLIGYQKQWTIGPVLRPGKNEFSCKDWLDKQPPKSVLYIRFVTSTLFSDEQTKELAMGLELSKQKFIWVLSKPNEGDIFTGADPDKRFDVPVGFEERVNGVGLVLREWAPQAEILGHPSIGGFLSSCEWNSCVDTITMGVPIIAWPTDSNHPKNGFLMTELLRIGLVVRGWDQRRDEVVTAWTIDDVVRKLMASEEGEEIRKRAKQLGEAVRLSIQKGGVSQTQLDSFIAHITR